MKCCRWSLIALVVLTAGLRLAYVYPSRVADAGNESLGAEPEMSAVSLVRQGVLGNVYHDPTGPTAHVSPLHPLMLAAIYAVFGPHTLAALLAQSLLAIAALAVTLACLPWLARRIGLSEAAGWLAAFGLAVVPLNFFYETQGNWEQPFAALVLIGLLACIWELRQSAWQRPALIGGAGLLSGIAALLSPSLLPAIALMMLIEFIWPMAPRRRIFLGGIAIVAVTALLVAPWTIRNYRELGHFVPLRSNFGLELAFGNNPAATGSSNWTDAATSRIRHPQTTTEECQLLKDMGEVAYMRQRQAEAFRWIQENPGRFVELTIRRTRMFWFPGPEMFPAASLVNWIKIAAFGAISVLAFIALIRLALRRTVVAGLFAACLFGSSAIYLITHVELRYRLTVLPLCALLAADLVVVLTVWLLNRRHRIAPSAAPISN